ncbi:hypothetical protein PbB2_00080 [Candidatus Phycosocius bacilliformis]|uniref:Uncharacterized protein n=1 Tax=Candidatus Phycosocius bacilliformis TaxID=1445552 RepID=A0A2P2E5U6_9PROT|nr:hypothetical protein PbB2_00080 [Candidatus Phycosocius bacilliformis]
MAGADMFTVIDWKGGGLSVRIGKTWHVQLSDDGRAAL